MFSLLLWCVVFIVFCCIVGVSNVCAERACHLGQPPPEFNFDASDNPTCFFIRNQFIGNFVLDSLNILKKHLELQGKSRAALDK